MRHPSYNYVYKTDDQLKNIFKKMIKVLYPERVGFRYFTAYLKPQIKSFGLDVKFQKEQKYEERIEMIEKMKW